MRKARKTKDHIFVKREDWSHVFFPASGKKAPIVYFGHYRTNSLSHYSRIHLFFLEHPRINTELKLTPRFFSTLSTEALTSRGHTNHIKQILFSQFSWLGFNRRSYMRCLARIATCILLFCSTTIGSDWYSCE